jgi:hypothetical protein
MELYETNGKVKDKNIEISFEKYSIYKELLESSPIYQIDNLLIKKIDNDKGQTRHFEENVYLLDLDTVDSFFHFLDDLIGNFLVLMNQVKDLHCVALIRKPLIISKKEVGRYEDDNEAARRLSEYVYDVLNHLKSLNIKISFLNINDYKSVSFKNIFIINSEFNSYINIKEVNSETAYCGPNLVVPLLQKAFRLTEGPKKNNKIFITRKSENSKVRNLKKRMDVIKQRFPNGIKKYIKKIGIGNFEKINHRFISMQDEEMLEDFFKNKGYQIINPGLLTFKQQIELFYTTDVVAGLSGAAFINTIFCKDKAKVIILNTSTGYSFEHNYWPAAANLEVINIPDLVKGGNKKYNAEKLINILKDIPDI